MVDQSRKNNVYLFRELNNYVWLQDISMRNVDDEIKSSESEVRNWEKFIQFSIELNFLKFSRSGKIVSWNEWHSHNKQLFT